MFLSPDEQFLYLEARPDGGGHKIWPIGEDGSLGDVMGIDAGGWPRDIGAWHPLGAVLVAGAVDGNSHNVLGIRDFNQSNSPRKIIGYMPRRFGGDAFTSLAWHPTAPAIAVAMSDSLFLVNPDTGGYSKQWLGGPGSAVAVTDTSDRVTISNGSTYVLDFDGNGSVPPLSIHDPYSLKSGEVGPFTFRHSGFIGGGIDLWNTNESRKLIWMRIDAQQVEGHRDRLTYCRNKAPEGPTGRTHLRFVESFD